MDIRTVILETSLQKTQETTGKKENQRFRTGKEQQASEGAKNQIVQNDLEYADDKQLLIERDTHEQMCERMGNYDIATETRELDIQWKKAERLSHGKIQSKSHYQHRSTK